MRHLSMRHAHQMVAGIMLAAFTAGCSREQAAAPPERTFPSAEAAAAALVAAAGRYDVPELKAILGAAGDILVSSEDTVLDRNHALAFAAEAQAQQHLDFDSTKSSAVLSVGPADWPMPIPIVEKDGKWYFDAPAGKEEILRRRIGQNELDAITVCLGFVEAQREYSLVRHDGAIVNQYAQRIISTPGKQDGLAWRDANGTWQGPVGEDIAGFIEEGYSDKSRPFHGYYFKVLKGQGPSAPLGEMDFMVEGAMIGGFALVAAPADYGVTGIQTFIVSWEGTVYQKDLGEKTLDAFKAMERYNPDSTWQAVEDPAP
jgi:hypothetical protein